MTNKSFNFTVKALSNLPNHSVEANTITYYYDTQIRGFGLYVTRKGIKSYFVYRKVESKPTRIILGRMDEMSLDKARAKALEVNSQIAEGINPQEKKQAIRKEITLGELWEMYLERHAKLHRSSWTNDASIYRLHLKHWESNKLSYITVERIRNLHTKIGQEKGTVTANHVHSLLRLMLNKAIEWGWNKPNPAYAVKRFKEYSRERFLSREEMQRFLAALNDEPNITIRDFFYIALFTGARRSNVEAMRWQNVDFNTANWTIPHTKNGKPHTVPLVKPAIEILQRRKLSTNSEWVFSSNKSASGHITNPLYAWYQIIKRADIENLRIHDLRRTLGSWQAALGSNSYVIGKSLGHSSQHATAIYARLDLNPVRQSVDNAVQAMLEPD